ncbi:MAG: hypothetical protein AB7V36_09430 [Bacteroidales bacterium]|jgi:hypothetical protein|nr:hypothetical protein [Bacteroidales bacterium]
MKKIFSVVLMVFVFGALVSNAQNFKYSVKASADCTNLKVEFTVPTGKVAKLMSLDIVTSFATCNVSQPAPTYNYAIVYNKIGKTEKSKQSFLYKKTVTSAGAVTESVPIQDVKLNPGVYVLEISRAPNLEATLEVMIK